LKLKTLSIHHYTKVRN